MLNKQKGDMYPWCSHTINPIRGDCPHNCIYCYVRTFRAKHLYQGDPYLVDSFFKKGLGKNKTIFMGSCFDLFADEIKPDWVCRILTKCHSYPDNTYLFQSKNTLNMARYTDLFPPNVIVGTTAETDRLTPMISKAPAPTERLNWLSFFEKAQRFVSIEPIMDFELIWFVRFLQLADPSFVSIGADSKSHNLPEPPAGKIKELIRELEKFTTVKLKDNLERLLK